MSDHEDAFEAFVEASYARLVRLARSVDPYDPGQAEDNVQTALVRVAQRFPSISDPYRYACLRGTHSSSWTRSRCAL
jgi:DNA-directed RNA polymerase specialized sigma24 family protein